MLPFRQIFDEKIILIMIRWSLLGYFVMLALVNALAMLDRSSYYHDTTFDKIPIGGILGLNQVTVSFD